VNQKKCPKCGENNPAEAVMCWACYTPLSGGGAVAAGAGAATASGAVAAPGTAVAHEESNKKAIPPWQIGVIVVALLLGIGFGVSQFMGGSSSDVIEGPGGTEYSAPLAEPINPGSEPPPQVSGPAPEPGPVTGGPVQPEFAPFDMIAPPNINSQWGVMAIVPTRSGVDGRKAVALAAFARRAFQNPRWRAVHVYVFADRQAALQFKEYQRNRQSEVLGAGDMAALSNLWSRCVVRYEFNGGRENVRYPSRNPSGWWRS
jgi:hypothetical protein